MASAQKFKIDLRAALLADAGLAALISQRLYAVKVSAELVPATPYVVMATVSGSGLYAHDGPTGNEDLRIQFTIFAPLADTLEQVRDALKDCMEGLAGTTKGNTRFAHVAFENDVDTFESEATQLKTKTIDFRLTIRTIGSD